MRIKKHLLLLLILIIMLSTLNSVAFGDNQFIENLGSKESFQISSSNRMVGADYAWNTAGYKGQGMVIGVIDTGIDPKSADMKISDGVDVKLNKIDVISKNLPGQYKSKKIPYGYNYFDENNNILDANDVFHGNFVGAIVGGNGNILGLAPEAQLLAMKTSTRDVNYPETFSQLYLKAIKDSVKLGADVINMSLGDDAFFYHPNDEVDQIISDASKKGIIFVIAAGNAGYSASEYEDNFLDASNPDIGLVAHPSLTKDSISVASMENTHMMTNYISYGQNKKAPYKNTSPHKLAGLSKYSNVEFVYVGLGSQDDFKGKNVKGKVALMMRGDLDPNDKILNAENAGALAAIIYNHKEGGEEMISLTYPDEKGNIPALFISFNSGEELRNIPIKKISFPKDFMEIPNPNGGKMSYFSSWGTSPSLDIKPEITGPGSRIYSNLGDDEYGLADGTSLSTPNLAGGAAIIKQHIIKEHPNMATSEIAGFTKALLMNTACPIKDEEGNYYSPRRQGAGLLNLQGALTTGVTLTNISDNEAKVKLGAFKEKTFKIDLLVKNHSANKLKYNIELDVLADYIDPKTGFNMMRSESLSGVKLSGDSFVSLEAFESKTISLGVDIQNAKTPGLDKPIEKNMFIEGFVRLLPPQDQAYPSLLVPYLGFYGDWYGQDSPRVLDGMVNFDEKSHFKEAGLVNQNGDYMGYNPTEAYKDSINRLSISPESDQDTANTHINARLSFMRNAEEVQINILDKDGRKIRGVNAEKWILKDFYYKDKKDYPPIIEANAWDGKVKGQVVEDGKYFYEIKAKPHNGDYQTYKYPVYVDTVAPVVSDLKYEENQVSFKVHDNKLSHIYLHVGEKEPELFEANKNGFYNLKVSDGVKEGTKIQVQAFDYAGNVSSKIVNQAKGELPNLRFESPEIFKVYNDNTVDISGEVFSKLGIASLSAYLVRDGNEKETIKLDLPIEKESRINKKVQDLKDGAYKLKILAKDIEGQKEEIVRYFHVDTSPPKISNIQARQIKKSSNAYKSLDLKMRVEENYGGFKVYVDESLVYYKDQAKLEAIRKPFDGEISFRVDLLNGTSDLTIKVVDQVKNETTYEIKTELLPVK